MNQVRVSSFCSAGGCVEVTITPDTVQLRATGRDDAVAVTHAEWAAFLAGAKAGEFDLPVTPQDGGPPVPVSGLEQSVARLRRRADGHDVPFAVLDASYVLAELVRLSTLVEVRLGPDARRGAGAAPAVPAGPGDTVPRAPVEALLRAGDDVHDAVTRCNPADQNQLRFVLAALDAWQVAKREVRRHLDATTNQLEEGNHV